MCGAPLWSTEEDEAVRRLYPNYQALADALPRRNYSSIRHRARRLGVAIKKHVWTGADLVRLRRVYPKGTPAEIMAAFPGQTYSSIKNAAKFYKVHKRRKPYAPTGIPAIDQIRQRAFELGYRMPDVDALAGSRRYFQHAGWHTGHLHKKAIYKAIVALDGDVEASWHKQ